MVIFAETIKRIQPKDNPHIEPLHRYNINQERLKLRLLFKCFVGILLDLNAFSYYQLANNILNNFKLIRCDFNKSFENQLKDMMKEAFVDLDIDNCPIENMIGSFFNPPPLFDFSTFDHKIDRESAERLKDEFPNFK